MHNSAYVYLSIVRMYIHIYIYEHNAQVYIYIHIYIYMYIGCARMVGWVGPCASNTLHALWPCLAHVWLKVQESSGSLSPFSPRSPCQGEGHAGGLQEYPGVPGYSPPGVFVLSHGWSPCGSQLVIVAFQLAASRLSSCGFRAGDRSGSG